MSLEAALAEHTAALKANTAINADLLAATKDLLALRNDAIDKVSAAVNNGKGAKDKKTDTAATENKVGEDAGKGQISTSPENRANPYEGIKELIAGYLTEIDRPEEREARKEKIRNLLNHEKIKKPDVEKATAADHIKEDAIDLFKDQIAKLKAKGALTEPAKKSDDLDL
ncbi:hypothetical protein EN780_03250 [Mesorhizobium sp. M4B.F.Ca.ET.089.01.1.1]|uniref:hypothetical protein n=1 Tax=Mesorhizobium sp. M4B.F.Ca.ET.089.01.1.1 TaxID=2496662 RepID=UPI000FE43212|nr:hypothetical protein [Mesorhizobium sp. M4B.F.Ca.ET.089.01.1.1]RWX70424.1 hypothetical protein EN780_03250 [Mesorhizobium sp. M4B.F.Ca.ET.089.01.1.1]